MNKLRYLIGTLVVLFLFTACEKEDSLGLSKQTNYAVFTMTGDKLIVMDKGTAYVEPGVSAKEAGAESTVTTTGTVDTSTPGIYKISYSAVNVDGYAASIERYVIVIDKVAVAGSNLVGSYERTFYGSAKSGTFSDWTKVNDWTYTCKDPGGVNSGDYGFDMTVYLVDASHIVVPIQNNPLGGMIYCTSTKAGDTPDSILIDTTLPRHKYIWSVKGSGFGTNPRHFEKV